jgi:anti-sigma B factor antagonist
MPARIVKHLRGNGLIVAYALPYNRQPVSDALVIDRSESFPAQEVLILSGPLTAPNGPVFLNAMRREEPTETLILDLRDVPYVDSAGLGLLVTAYVSRQKTGRKMVLTGLNPRVQKLLEITRVASLFLVFASPVEAIAALSNAAQA